VERPHRQAASTWSPERLAERAGGRIRRWSGAPAGVDLPHVAGGVPPPQDLAVVVEVPWVGATVVHGRVDEPGLVLERTKEGVVADLRQVRLAQVPEQLLALQPACAHGEPPGSLA
jgi:hypothetical protein